jgi:hypothetical protein
MLHLQPGDMPESLKRLTPDAAGLPEYAKDLLSIREMLDTAISQLSTAPQTWNPKLGRILLDVTNARDLAVNALAAEQIDHDYEAAIEPLRATTGGAPETTPSAWDIANEITSQAGDIRHLMDVLVFEVCELSAPAGSVNYGHVCRANAVARSLETLAHSLEAQCDEAFRIISREVRS